MHLTNLEEQEWLRRRFEAPYASQLNAAQQKVLFKRLIRSTKFEDFLAKVWRGFAAATPHATRLVSLAEMAVGEAFWPRGLRGKLAPARASEWRSTTRLVQVLVPAIKQLIDRSSSMGVDSFVIGKRSKKSASGVLIRSVNKKNSMQLLTPNMPCLCYACRNAAQRPPQRSF